MFRFAPKRPRRRSLYTGVHMLEKRARSPESSGIVRPVQRGEWTSRDRFRSQQVSSKNDRIIQKRLCADRNTPMDFGFSILDWAYDQAGPHLADATGLGQRIDSERRW